MRAKSTDHHECRPSLEAALLLAAISVASWQFGVLTAAVLVASVLILTLAKQLASTPEVNAGHRAGGKGFAGAGCFFLIWIMSASGTHEYCGSCQAIA